MKHISKEILENIETLKTNMHSNRPQLNVHCNKIQPFYMIRGHNSYDGIMLEMRYRFHYSQFNINLYI